MSLVNMSSPKIVPNNRLIAYVIPGIKKDVMQSIRPCKITRDWMDNTPARYAYRCIPLTAANSMGWEILNPVDAEISWTGPENGDQLNIKTNHQDPFGPKPHFGTGTVTWYIPFLFRTPPDYGLLVSGPANQDKNFAVPLDAFIRSDWLPFPFTMNWRMTEPNKTVKFKAGEPICRIMPYPLALLDDMQLEIHDMHEDPNFMQEVKQWDKQRAGNYQSQRKAEQQWADEGRKPELKELWDSNYAKGQAATPPKSKHQNLFKCSAPIDKRVK
ncbi:MAG: hypothetical protein ACJAXS_003052 [Colwellia sp.]|jgi:hypothetical protein